MFCRGREKERGRDHRRACEEGGEPKSHRTTDWDKETPQTERGYGEGDTPYTRVRGMYVEEECFFDKMALSYNQRTHNSDDS